MFMLKDHAVILVYCQKCRRLHRIIDSNCQRQQQFRGTLHKMKCVNINAP